MTGGDAQMVRAVYLAMKLTTWFVIVPLAFVSLVSGIMSSLGTCWGLLGHYWVLLKLLITIRATIVLLIHTRPIDRLASIRGWAPGSAGHDGVRLRCRRRRAARSYHAVGIQAARRNTLWLAYKA